MCCTSCEHVPESIGPDELYEAIYSQEPGEFSRQREKRIEKDMLGKNSLL